MPDIERRYYTADTLRAELDAFERTYGLSSEVHYELRYADECPREVGPFESHVWAETYRTWRRLNA